MSMTPMATAGAPAPQASPAARGDGFANATPFAALALPFQDDQGADVVIVLAKATFFVRNGRLHLADEQSPIRTADVFTDPAAVDQGRESSVRYPSDLGGVKSGADIVVVGSAVSAKAVASADVVVRAPAVEVTLRVHGERVYYRSALGMKISPAARFERAAIGYERAYGGASRDGSVIDWRNPVGRGVHVSAGELDGAPAPSVEDPAQPIRDGGQASRPVGFGAIPTWWLPRRAFAGTMDRAWLAERMPLPPLDFDRKHHQVANSSLQMDRPLRGGDLLAAHGLRVEGPFIVTVPDLGLCAHLHRDAVQRAALQLTLDTALLEPDEESVELTFRGVVPLGRGKTLLREVRLDVDP